MFHKMQIPNDHDMVITTTKWWMESLRFLMLTWRIRDKQKDHDVVVSNHNVVPRICQVYIFQTLGRFQKVEALGLRLLMKKNPSKNPLGLDSKLES